MATEPRAEESPEDECSCGHQRKDHEGARCNKCFLPARQDWNHAFIYDPEVN